VSGHTATTRRSRNRRRQVHRRRIEVVCTDCAFGAVVTTPPTRCPMCGGSTWRERRPIEKHVLEIYGKEATKR
jgi:rubrerythrin